MNLILASSSPRRRELLDQLNIPYRIQVPEGVDEESVSGTAYSVSRELARMKAEWVLENGEPGEDALVIGCDTVVSIVSGSQERILGKPADEAEARQMLGVLSGTSHRVISAVAVARPSTPTRVEAEVSHVTFRQLKETDIDAYVQSGDPMDKAGAYGIQTAGQELVASIRGCYLNIVGLPLMLLCSMLKLETSYACPCASHDLQTCASGCALKEGGAPA
jgi:septum formation protein